MPSSWLGCKPSRCCSISELIFSWLDCIESCSCSASAVLFSIRMFQCNVKLSSLKLPFSNFFSASFSSEKVIFFSVSS
uniref:Uncharacterized protein n=1 Tax=Arundo donax TaxID=35708 RepID=A0A0A8XU29_ARUDO